MKTINKELIGQKVVCYEPYTRNILENAKEVVVNNVGSKYITVGKLKYDKETLSSDIMNYRLYIGTYNEFEKSISLLNTIKTSMEEIRRKTEINTPLNLLEQTLIQLTEVCKLLNAEED